MLRRGPATAAACRGRRSQTDDVGPASCGGNNANRAQHRCHHAVQVSFDDACRAAVAEAAKTLRGIMSFRVKEAECVVEHDKIIAYRVTGKIVFLVER